MIGFIEDHRSAYGVEPICRVLPIAPSTYHEHAAQRDEVLKQEVKRVFETNFGVYGVRKVWRQLLREGFRVARCTVARLMRIMGLKGVIRGKPVRTTISDKAAVSPLDQSGLALSRIRRRSHFRLSSQAKSPDTDPSVS
jgi:putative transposase